MGSRDESNLPVASFWTDHPMTQEEAQQLFDRVKFFWHEEFFAVQFRKLLRQGGGFLGRGITDAPELTWPRQLLVYMPPLPGYWNEEGKSRLLQQLEDVYAAIKREIEEA